MATGETEPFSSFLVFVLVLAYCQEGCDTFVKGMQVLLKATSENNDEVEGGRPPAAARKEPSPAAMLHCAITIESEL